MAEKITRAELARRFHVSRMSVTRWVRRGCPVDPGGKLDAAKAVAWVEAYRLIGRGGAEARKRSVRRMPTPEEWSDLGRAAAEFLDGWKPDL